MSTRTCYAAGAFWHCRRALFLLSSFILGLYTQVGIRVTVRFLESGSWPHFLREFRKYGLTQT